ncbi:hypothetical protein OKA04_07900 [Luteolibacter flavescens]|uniref:SH3 domain-containing protein n=1 Tax=Luteolibacter flavescens TaxID=1859460 RepID=A0ABT3FNU4_9BACT|nr:hypothetical protein [Luteolibacter flavescens]MCW1884650.1 hypothetical protein [Luteolibacter flavescens]
MKPILPIVAGVAIVAAGVPFFSESSQAQQPAGTPAGKAVTNPVGSRCVVTLDPNYPSSRRSGGASSDNFEVTDNKVQGDLSSISSEWIVLKEGNYENWIPRDKVLSMRVSR